MAKFCKHCGRKLEDGEICVCQQPEQAAAPEQMGAAQEDAAQAFSAQADPQVGQGSASDQVWQAGPAQGGAQSGGSGIDSEWINRQKQVLVSGTKSALGEIRPILRQPVSRVRELSQSGDGRVGKELIIGKAAVFMVVSLLALMILSNNIQNMSYGLVSVEMPYIQVLIAVLLLTAGVDFLEAFILKGISGVFHGVTTSNAMMNVIGARGIYDTIIMLICVVAALLSTNVASIALVLFITLSSIMELAIYQGTVQMDENKKPYAFFVVKICMMIIMFIVTVLFLSSTLDSLSGSLLRYMM